MADVSFAHLFYIKKKQQNSKDEPAGTEGWPVVVWVINPSLGRAVPSGTNILPTALPSSHLWDSIVPL